MRLHVLLPNIAQTNMFHNLFVPECANYSLHVYYFKKGLDEDIIAVHEGGVTEELCIDRCLDMDECRGVSYSYTWGNCTYHNSSTYIPDGYKGYNYFIERRCLSDIYSGTYMKQLLTYPHITTITKF